MPETGRFEFRDGSLQTVKMDGIRSAQRSGHSTNQAPCPWWPSRCSTKARHSCSSQVCVSVCLAQGSPVPKSPSGGDRPGCRYVPRHASHPSTGKPWIRQHVPFWASGPCGCTPQQSGSRKMHRLFELARASMLCQKTCAPFSRKRKCSTLQHFGEKNVGRLGREAIHGCRECLEHEPPTFGLGRSTAITYFRTCSSVGTSSGALGPQWLPAVQSMQSRRWKMGPTLGSRCTSG